MIAYIVTEGRSDVETLQRLLPQELQEDVQFMPGAGLSNAESLVRTLLVQHRTPVALVMDADAVAPEVIQERRQGAEEVIGIVAGGVPYRIIVAVPTLEAVLFQDIPALERLLDRSLSDTDRLLAHYDPKAALDRLLGETRKFKDRRELLDALAAHDIDALRQADPIRDLMQFLDEARASAAGGRATAAT